MIMLNRDHWIRLQIAVFVGCVFAVSLFAAEETYELDRAAGHYQKDYSPADGREAAVNPPPFIWVPPKDDLTYVLELSTTPDFSSNVQRILDIPISTYAMHTPLTSGQWYWRYGVQLEDHTIQFSKMRSFEITNTTPVWIVPPITEVIQSIPKERPRLFILKQDLESFRNRAREGDLQNQLRAIQRTCDRHIGEDLVKEPPYVQGTGPERGKNYQQIFRTTRPPMDLMETCALAYLLSGDEKYGLEAKRRILHFFGWDPEGSTAYKNNDEPAMWVMMRGTRAYDWTYDLFAPEERELVEKSMRVRAAQFYDHLKNRRRFHTNPYESHAGRTLGFLGEAALSFAHEWPESSEWLDYVLTLFRNVYPAWGKDDGGWHEGPSYWSYYMGFALHFVVPLRNAAGVDLMRKPFFQNTPYYKLYTNPPYAKISPFGDGEHRGPNNSMGQLMYQFSTLLQDPYLRWYADAMDAGPGSSILGVVLKDDALQAKSPAALPHSRYFPGVGLVSLHGQLGSAEEDVHFLIHSDPYGPISHAHADQNAFTLEAYGEALAIASGYYPWYGSKHHSHWQWESKSSNTITFDGGIGQKKRDPVSKGKILAFSTFDDYSYVSADASAAYQGGLTQFIRQVIHIRPDIFVIHDTVQAPKEVRFEWRLHAFSEMTLQPEQGYVTSAQGSARLRVQFLHPASLKMEQTKGFENPPEYGEPDQYHLIVYPSEKGNAEHFLTVLIPYKEGKENSLPKMTGGIEENAIGVEIKEQGATHLAAFKLDPSQKQFRFNYMESDAEASAVTIESDKNQKRFQYGGKFIQLMK